MKNHRASLVLTMNNVILIILCFSMLYPFLANENHIDSISQSSPTERKVSPRLASTKSRVSVENTILPITNLTVSQYITGQGQVNTYSTSVLSLNNTHWFTRSHYANTSTITSPFDSIIQRDSVNHTYPSSGYWNWEEEADEPFDFWIDPTGFEIDYVYSVYIEGYGIRNARITGLENITMLGVGIFEAWNITIDIPGFPNFAFYERNTGLVLCTYLEIIGDIWYNLTFTELAVLPDGYMGPTLKTFSPANLSVLASESLISVTLTSPYGVQQVNYHWDEEIDTLITSSDFQTPIPNLDGPHTLSMTGSDNIGYYFSYFLVYVTDNTLPGIILNDPRNNSKIQGSRDLNFTVVSGNGTFTYNWNYSLVNVSAPMSDDIVISVPSPEIESARILQVYIKSIITDVWVASTYRFIIDNTPPVIAIYDFENDSVLKGNAIIAFSSSERVEVSYSLNDGLKSIFFLDANLNSSLNFNNLENGTYNLDIRFKDEAGNFEALDMRFSIYSSSFNWNWYLEAEQTQAYDFIDENNALWFSFVIVSKIDQSFNISLLPGPDSPFLSPDMQFGIKLLCEVPDDILYVSFIYSLREPLLGANQSFPVLQWVRWEEQSQEWLDIGTIYNQVLHAWETTYIGYNQYFALVETDQSTQIRSVEVGGGGIPSFELPISIATMIIIYSLKSRKNKKIGEKHVYETN